MEDVDKNCPKYVSLQICGITWDTRSGNAKNARDHCKVQELTMNDRVQVQVTNLYHDVFSRVLSGTAPTKKLYANSVLQQLSYRKKMSGVAKHHHALSKEIKHSFECGAAHKSIRITKTDTKNATHAFLNGHQMQSMTESGPANHQDAHSAESSLSLTCGAQTYQSSE